MTAPIRVLLILFILSEFVAAILGAWKLWQFRNRWMMLKSVGLALTGIAIEIACSLIASSGSPPGFNRTPWFMWWYLSGRVVRAGTLWALVIYLMGLRAENK